MRLLRLSGIALLLGLCVALRGPDAAPAEGVGDPAQPSSAAETTASQVVGHINEETIFLDDVERKLGRMHGPLQMAERPDFDLDRLIFKLVNDVLLGQEARALGMDREEPIASRVTRHRQKLIVKLFEREEIDSRAKPTDEEVRRMFADQYRRISFRVVTAYVRDGAEALLARLVDGADMEALAKESSVDPYALRGGLVKELPRFDLQAEVAELAFGLEPGQLGGPVLTDLGWSVIRVISKREADDERFPAARKSVRRLVRHRKAQALRKALALRAREAHPVQVDEAVVKGIRPKRLADARLIPEYDDPDAVVARIGVEQVITAREYARALLDRWGGVRNEEAAVVAAPIILNNLIDKNILLAEALARGLANRPEIVRTVRAFETQLLVQRYLEEVVAPTVEITQEEMRAYYDSHENEFGMPPRLHLGQITVETMDEATRIATLLRGGTDLAWLVERHSIDRFKENGGDRGWMTLQLGTDEMNDRLLTAQAGDVLDPFGAPGNYIILKILARQEQGTFPYDSVSGNVRERVFSQQLQAALHRLITKLRSRSTIEIDEERLSRLRISGSQEERSSTENAPHEPGH